MFKQFFTNLSQNFVEILKDDNYNYYDITIEVGNGSNVRIFRAHKIIMCYRSPFLRRTLSSNKKNALAHIKLSNILPDTFQIILKYIYGGFISLNEQEPSEILKVLVAADQLLLQELINYLQTYLIENKSEWMEQCFGTYLPNSEPNDNILLPRSRNMYGIIDSKIVNLNIVSLISRWIDKIDIKSKYAYARELYLPYKFNLLLRGKRDGFTPKKFHELCDNKLCTVTFIKIKGTKEIIGGYNPLEWSSSGDYAKTKDSFIFSFKSKNNFKDSILSNVINVNYAMYYGDNVGPTFGRDIDIYVEMGNGSKEYNYCQCKQKYYERGIRDKEDLFLIEDYEVFQIIKKND
ncbi:BTB-domain-containing protein [Rhizophagus irregularis]|nr:BTB-domain-containing protein [Rhizophagus irregularis]